MNSNVLLYDIVKMKNTFTGIKDHHLKYGDTEVLRAEDADYAFVHLRYVDYENSQLSRYVLLKRQGRSDKWELLNQEYTLVGWLDPPSINLKNVADICLIDPKSHVEIPELSACVDREHSTGWQKLKLWFRYWFSTV